MFLSTAADVFESLHVGLSRETHGTPLHTLSHGATTCPGLVLGAGYQGTGSRPRVLCRDRGRAAARGRGSLRRSGGPLGNWRHTTTADTVHK